tara:strand:- start:1858 stop:3150 length:1293 start_codon:yes stop_codon:yes gene_type:complete
MVRVCKRCLYTENHPLGIVFDDEGICSGCRIHEEKDQLDWDARWRKLEQIVEPYRSADARFDCIVPISGAADSHFIVDIVVNQLKLKPLVVCYNRYFNTPEGIANLANLRMAFDVDFQLKNVNPEVVKKITRASLYKFGNMYWPVLAGHTVFPVQTAVMMGIPLIIWGAHQGLEQVGMFSHEHEVEMTRRYRKDHDLFGIEAAEMNGPFDDLTDEDLLNYRYPKFSDIESLDLRGIYLGNFVRWDPLAQHQQMVNRHGYRGRVQGRTFDLYDHADCYAYTGVHDLLKMFKHGYGKVRDQACREIRHGRLTRAEAAALVSWYEAREPLDMDLFADWLGTSSASLRYVLNRHRNPALWEEVEPNIWRRRPGTGTAHEIEDIGGPQTIQPTVPYEQPGLDPAMAEGARGYITVGRGVRFPRPPAPPESPQAFL